MIREQEKLQPLTIARQLAESIATRASQADRDGKLPAEDVAELKESGYLTLTVPREYGGYGASMREALTAHLAFAQGNTSTALVAGMHMHVFAHASETRRWPEETFERFCRTVTVGEGLFNSVASEPALGSPSRGGSFKSYADLSEDGRHWIVNGHKTWTTGGQHLTHLLVKLSMQDGNGLVAVESDREGVRWELIWGDALSLRASDSHDVYFEDVRVPRENCLETPDTPPNPPNLWFPMVMSATYLGAAFAARDAVITYALERVPTALGRPIATLPKIQRQVGEIDTALQAARALLLDVAADWNGTGDVAARKGMLPRIAAAKMMAIDTAIDVTDKALKVAGGNSIMRDLPLERYFRDVRAGSMHPPSGDEAFELVGKAALGPLAEPE